MLISLFRVSETAPVVGNGMTLGMIGKKSDGTLVNFGFFPSTMYETGNSGVPFINPSSYGTPIGTSASDTNNTLNKRSIGVTTDPAKSGMVVTFSGLTLGTIPSEKLGSFYIRY